jgi:hypothetical protein
MVAVEIVIIRDTVIGKPVIDEVKISAVEVSTRKRAESVLEIVNTFLDYMRKGDEKDTKSRA